MGRIDTGQFAPEAITRFTARFGPESRFVVAYSGGADSLALLHAFTVVRERDHGLRLCAVHVDHHLHADSTRWARQCMEVCRQLCVDLVVLDADVTAKSAGHCDEGAARTARYRALERIVATHDVLCTAHSSDDHVETVLLNLLRGAGTRGLAGIPDKRPLGAGIVARPAREFPRAALRAYARETGLPLVQDPANEDQRFARVLLRAKVLPALEARWPAARTTLARAAEHSRECTELLEALAALDLDRAGGIGAVSLDTAPLAALDSARRRNAVASWLRARGIATPGARRIRQIAHEVVEARSDAMPCVTLGTIEVRRYRGRIHLVPRARPIAAGRIRWRMPEDLELDHGRLAWERCETGGLGDEVPHAQIVVRFRGDDASSMWPLRVRGHSLKKRFQDLGIPPWERGHVPLICAGDELAAIGSQWINPRLSVAPGMPGWRVVWTPWPDATEPQ